MSLDEIGIDDDSSAYREITTVNNIKKDEKVYNYNYDEMQI